MRIRAAGLCVLLAVVLATGQPLKATEACEGLTSLKLPNAMITLAVPVDAGPFSPAAQSFNAPRAFCRVAATLKPSSDSDIKIEVWMPAANWNQKFQAVGNGAFSGAIAYPAMMTALGRGYATASTDTGHAGGAARASASGIRRK